MIGLLISNSILSGAAIALVLLVLLVLPVVAVLLIVLVPFRSIVERQLTPRCRLCDRRRRPSECLFAQCPNRKKP